MEIQMIARLSDAGISSLAHPSIFELGGIYPRRRFLQWGALILAFMYALGSLARRVKILFFQRRRGTSKLSSSAHPSFDSSDEEDDVVSSSDEEEDSEQDVDDSASRSSEDESDERGGSFYDDFRVAGSVNSGDRGGRKRKFKIHKRKSLANENPFSLAELVSGKGVVKLWDDLDLDKSATIGTIMGQFPALSVSPSSPKVVLAAYTGGEGSVEISSWDMRLRRRKPTVEAEWKLDRQTGPVLEVEAGGIDKVFLRDGASRKTTVGDMRKANFPLVEVTEYDGNKWFDAAGVTETEE